MPPTDFHYGDRVRKLTGYSFDGTIQAVFYKRDGQKRVIVESEVIPGLLHIFSPEQLERADYEEC